MFWQRETAWFSFNQRYAFQPVHPLSSAENPSWPLLAIPSRKKEHTWRTSRQISRHGETILQTLLSGAKFPFRLWSLLLISLGPVLATLFRFLTHMLVSDKMNVGGELDFVHPCNTRASP
jgi:hypothetical protein